MIAGFPDVVRQKICPRCGIEFGCGPQRPGDTCWCDALPHLMAISEDGDCFCPACLAANCDATQRNTQTTTEARE
jgi:uncharacterized protein